MKAQWNAAHQKSRKFPKTPGEFWITLNSSSAFADHNSGYRATPELRIARLDVKFRAL